MLNLSGEEGNFNKNKYYNTPVSSLTFSKMEKIIWPIYGIILLMVLSFWLGEREEYFHLGRKHKLKNLKI